MDLKIVRDRFDRIVKKQEVSTTEYHQMIDRINVQIKQAITDLQSADATSSVDHKSVIKHLGDKIDARSLQEQLKISQKDLKVDLNNYPKILGVFVDTDISKASRDVEFDSHIVNQIILNLLYHERLFDVADIFINEAQEPDIISLRSQFSKMHEILDALKAKNLEPALDWVSVNRQQLDQGRSNLEFHLRRLQFLDLLKEDVSAAINFAKTHLSPFASAHKNELSDLMGCLISPGNLETSSYSDLLSPKKWAAVSHEFMVQFCGSMGMSFKNPLAVTVDAGAQGLPTILNMANQMTREEWAAMRQDPVAMDLGREFQFHSAFVCPVCWEQSGDDNPPTMIYDCGHVLCSKTTRTIIAYRLKCPLCPTERPVIICRQLHI
ncbi:hypothetical protein L1887_04372 [Cichorium endivia]|nr:hypothetical protein L1887_04372 [Cichorium endivia]